MKPREHVGHCRTNIRHWFTIYGAPGSRRANCGHCRQPHPSIRAALERGLYYARLYSAAVDSPDFDKDTRTQTRDVKLIEEAIERVRNEHAAAHRR